MTLSQDAQKGRPARPQRVKGRGVPLGYAEGLNDARTKLADFFSILTTSRAKAAKTGSSKVPNRHLAPYCSSRGECWEACLRIWATRVVA